MSAYLNKSNENIECARYLYKSKKYYPSIVHSSYYSIFQLGKYILINELLRSEISLNDEQNNLNIGVHELYCNLLVKFISESDDELAFEVNHIWNMLKKDRISSDYKEIEINVINYGLIIKQAESLLNKLKTKFKII